MAAMSFPRSSRSTHNLIRNVTGSGYGPDHHDGPPAGGQESVGESTNYERRILIMRNSSDRDMLSIPGHHTDPGCPAATGWSQETGALHPVPTSRSKEAENVELKDEIIRLRMELEEAKRQSGRPHRDILIYPAVDTLLHQAKLLSSLICQQNGMAARLSLPPTSRGESSIPGE